MTSRDIFIKALKNEILEGIDTYGVDIDDVADRIMRLVDFAVANPDVVKIEKDKNV